jgi:hypothetical protein
MFERFTDRARRVVVLAQDEAQLLNHNYIGTEHILLGLVRDGEGVGAAVLEALGISLGAVREQVLTAVRPGDTVPSGHIPFTPRAKKVLELSLREGLQLGHHYIGTEHILLGLIREGEGVAAVVLASLGAEINLVRKEVILRSGHSESGTTLKAEAAAEYVNLKRLFESLSRLLGPIEPGHPDESLTVSAPPEIRAVFDEVRRLKDLDRSTATDARYFVDQRRGLLLRRIGGTDRVWGGGSWDPAQGAILAYMAGAYYLDEMTDGEARALAPDAFAGSSDLPTPAWHSCECGRILIDEPMSLRDFDLRIWRTRKDIEAAMEGHNAEAAATLRDSEKTLLSQKATLERDWRCECDRPRAMP